MLQAIFCSSLLCSTFELLTAMMEVFDMKYIMSGDVRTGGVPEGNLIGTSSFFGIMKKLKKVFLA